MLSAICFSLDQSKIFSSGTEFKNSNGILCIARHINVQVQPLLAGQQKSNKIELDISINTLFLMTYDFVVSNYGVRTHVSGGAAAFSYPTAVLT